MADKVITRVELAKHNTATDLWIAIQGEVFDITRFAKFHPGGSEVLLGVAGTDATEEFYALHRHEVILKYGPKFKIGVLEGHDPEDVIPSGKEISGVPYAEPMFWRGFQSPYYNESHKKFREELRAFLHDEVKEEAERFEEAGKAPSKEVFLKMGACGLLASRIGPGDHLKYAPRLPGGVKPEEFDYFHEMIAHEEVSRMGTPGYGDGTGAGMVIGLPPVLQFGPEWMKEKVAKDVLSGEKRICLAITEPYAGSDVSAIRCTATKTEDGQFYIVNGTKKWITNGCQSDYFTTAVRTGGEGMGGISLLMIERQEGVETTQIKTSYASSAGTAYITFDNVKVPARNLIGMENGGFLCIMYNFNHERWMIISYLMSSLRGNIEECFKWANQRKAFGKRLLDQPVIRNKLARMAGAVESVNSWLEALTYQMCNMPYDQQSTRLAGLMAMLKYQTTRVAELVSDESVQIFGGRGITKTGMGKMIERFQRTFKFGAILGGSEEVMAELAVKMAMKQIPKNARL